MATDTAGRGASPSGGCARACWCSEGAAAARPPEPAALLGRHAGEEARSLLRNAGWPQASAAFSKEVLTLFLLGSSKPVLLCCWGWWWGMNCLVGVFKNTLDNKREQGAKMLQFYQLPSYLSPAVRHHGQLSANFSVAMHPKCLCEPDTWPARGSTATCFQSGAAFHFLSGVRPLALCPAHLRHISISSALCNCC